MLPAQPHLQFPRSKPAFLRTSIEAKGVSLSGAAHIPLSWPSLGRGRETLARLLVPLPPFTIEPREGKPLAPRHTARQWQKILRALHSSLWSSPPDLSNLTASCPRNMESKMSPQKILKAPSSLLRPPESFSHTSCRLHAAVKGSSLLHLQEDKLLCWRRQ